MAIPPPMGPKEMLIDKIQDRIRLLRHDVKPFKMAKNVAAWLENPTMAAKIGQMAQGFSERFDLETKAMLEDVRDEMSVEG